MAQENKKEKCIKDAGLTLLASQLNRLFQLSSEQGTNFTNDYVAEKLKEYDPELKVSGCYLSALRKGKKSNPSIDILVELAKFFGVSVDYFVNPTNTDAFSTINDHSLQEIAIRAAGLDKASLHLVTNLLDNLRQLRGLPPVINHEI